MSAVDIHSAGPEAPRPCAGKTALFFDETSARSVAEAKALCGSCEHVAPCLASALESDERDGIWGATTPAERRVILKRHRRAS